MKKLSNSKVLSLSNSPAFFLLTSVLAIILAYVAEYGFGYKPCFLCILERIPYYLVLIASLILWKFASKGLKLAKWLQLIIILSFLSGGMISIYHVGIEQGFISEPSSCSIGIKEAFSSLDELKKAIQNSLGNGMPKCSDVQFRVLGLSAASMNLIFSFVMCYLAIRRFILKL
ncbi:MAG: disulfide bond formation protein B [Rickettsiales bacterium]